MTPHPSSQAEYSPSENPSVNAWNGDYYSNKTFVFKGYFLPEVTWDNLVS
jgi:hypothetical protein